MRLKEKKEKRKLKKKIEKKLELFVDYKRKKRIYIFKVLIKVLLIIFHKKIYMNLLINMKKIC